MMECNNLPRMYNHTSTHTTFDTNLGASSKLSYFPKPNLVGSPVCGIFLIMICTIERLYHEGEEAG